MSKDKVYIGDGVYADFDGYQVWLFTQRENGTDRIALGPDEFDTLFKYVMDLKPPLFNTFKEVNKHDL